MMSIDTALLAGVLLMETASLALRLRRAPAPEPVSTYAPPPTRTELNFELVGRAGTVRSWVHTTKFDAAPAEYVYGTTTYVRAPKQLKKGVYTYVEKT